MFEFGDQVRISKYKNILAKGHAPNFAEEVSWLKKLKILFHGLMLFAILLGEEILGTFYEKELQTKTNRKEFRIKKVIRKKGDKPYVKWIGYNSSFNSWIDKNDIVI